MAGVRTCHSPTTLLGYWLICILPVAFRLIPSLKPVLPFRVRPTWVQMWWRIWKLWSWFTINSYARISHGLASIHSPHRHTTDSIITTGLKLRLIVGLCGRTNSRISTGFVLHYFIQSCPVFGDTLRAIVTILRVCRMSISASREVQLSARCW